MLDVDRPLPASAAALPAREPAADARGREAALRARARARPASRPRTLDPTLRFEGEADFFPAGGALPLHARPPRAAALRARARDPALEARLRLPHRRARRARAGARASRRAPVLRVELVLEAHYHGDTALCAFGPRRELLLAYRAAIAPARLAAPRGRLRRRADRARRGRRAALRRERLHLHPGGTDVGVATWSCRAASRERLLDAVRERGVTPHHRRRLRVPEEGRRLGEVHDRGSGADRRGRGRSLRPYSG